MKLFDMTSTPLIKIDKNSVIPIYVQLKQRIEHLIQSGQLTPGDSIPSETTLSRDHNISPMTVRQAMAELVNDGLVKRERGRGTFVAERRLSHPLENLISFTEDIVVRNMKPGSKILLLEHVETPQFLMTQKGLGNNLRGTRLKRIRYVNDTAVGVHDSYVHGVRIEPELFTDQDSLYSYLEEGNLQIGDGHETLEAVSADEETAQILMVERKSPLLKTTRYSWDTNGNFLEYVVALYHPDLYQYTVQLRRQ